MRNLLNHCECLPTPCGGGACPSTGNYQIRVGAIHTNTVWSYTDWHTLSDTVHSIEFDWKRASTTTASDGRLDWWIDGSPQNGKQFIPNGNRRIDRVRLGAVTGLDTGTRGTYYFDAFESRRQSQIGSAVSPTPTPTLTPSQTPVPNITWGNPTTDANNYIGNGQPCFQVTEGSSLISFTRINPDIACSRFWNTFGAIYDSDSPFTADEASGGRAQWVFDIDYIDGNAGENTATSVTFHIASGVYQEGGWEPMECTNATWLALYRTGNLGACGNWLNGYLQGTLDAIGVRFALDVGDTLMASNFRIYLHGLQRPITPTPFGPQPQHLP